jgi:lipopolysaccharide biosynthesis glycosyltransferase
VTLAIGRQAEQWLDLSGPLFKAYAARHGCDYVVIGERAIRCRLQWRKARVNLHLEKFQIGPLLERYGRILYADADVLITPSCPDLFKLVPPEGLGVVADPSGALAWKRDEEMTRMQSRFGELPRPLAPYFNAGVLVLSAAHRELLRFERPRLMAGRWPEQTALNYYSAAWGLPRHYMDSRANFLPGHEGWSDKAARLSAWAVHYAGPDAKPFMAEDSAAL